MLGVCVCVRSRAGRRDREERRIDADSAALRADCAALSSEADAWTGVPLKGRPSTIIDNLENDLTLESPISKIFNKIFAAQGLCDSDAVVS